MSKSADADIRRQNEGLAARHTPGPWVVAEWKRSDNEETRIGVDAPSASIASTTGCYYKDADSLERRRANARLIAAAPELLKACEAVVAKHEASPSGRRICECSTCRLLRPAIAKATVGAA